MDVREFDFELPPELIAQQPSAERSTARLLQLSRRTGSLTHTIVARLPELLRAGDLLVVNNTRVIPARLLGRRVPGGGAVECLLIGRLPRDSQVSDKGTVPSSAPGGPPGRLPGQLYDALMHPGQKLKPGARVIFEGNPPLHGEVLERRFFGRRVIRLWTDDGSDVDAAVDTIGHVPLPPYIRRPDDETDRERYQTVFARARGSVAAPTAGLHFTPALVAALRAAGVEMVEITLHVGYGTFQPVRVERVEDHRVEPERFEITAAAAAAIECARSRGDRVIAVGTTTTRALEAVARAHGGQIVPGAGVADLFIYPGHSGHPDSDFRVISGLMTNFHLPRSSLLMLVAAFAGLDRVLTAYHAAIAAGYRFYSYGDAMLIL
jgi:S-adenosylmethionine:tRNA ribosyltransferase-isomerase